MAFASGALLKAVTFDAPVAETPDGRVARQRVVGASAACAGEPGDGEACRGQFQEEPGKNCRAVRYRCGERVGAFGQVGGQSSGGPRLPGVGCFQDALSVAGGEL
ncbi:hypothetical protein Shyhy01_69020 [Streptomyces hygroscopicus subsp. hygroscopicus]|nr:hypothetical protein Shyhy01_69020 [Streptomyces hygroscopicus subsp. hygroscopicus]